MSKNDKKSKKIFLSRNKKSRSLASRIEDACRGLAYISETDAPVTPFEGEAVLGEVGIETILQQTGGGENEAVRETSFEKFFERLTADREWHGEFERVRAKKFLDLQRLIEENLSELKVFKIGDVRIRIYAVGLDSAGHLMGITTNAVET